MTLLQSPFLHGILTKLVATWHPKARCYTTPLQSPLLHGNIFTKSYKAQILIWHLSYKTQILIWQLSLNNLALFYEIQIYFGNYFTKPKILFWQKQLLYAQTANVNSALILQNLNINLAPIS